MDPVISLTAPIMVDFEITNNCPYSCSFCEGDIKKHKSNKQLDTKTCLSILEKIAKSGVMNIFFTGGEPLSREDLPLLIKHSYKIGLEPSVSTNLYLLSDKKLEGLVNSGLKNIQVSIQGVGSVHDSIVKKPFSYNKIIDNLKKLLKTEIRTDVSSVGLKENLPYISELIKEVGSLGVKHFRLLRLVPSHSKEQIDAIPSKELIGKYLEKIRKSADENSVNLLLSFCPGFSSDFPSYLFEGIHPSTQTCPAGKTEFTISSNGDTYPCVSLKNDLEFKTGNILNNSVDEIWNNSSMKKMRNLTPSNYNGFCGKCERKWTCYSARCVANNIGGDIYGDDISCYQIRERSKLNG